MRCRPIPLSLRRSVPPSLFLSFSIYPMKSLQPPAPIGVGFTWQTELPEALGRGWELVDFLEISPDVSNILYSTGKCTL